MHRIIFCIICVLALLGVFGPGNTATARTGSATPYVQSSVLPVSR